LRCSGGSHTPVRAQAYPAKTIKLVVPFGQPAPGTPQAFSDFIAAEVRKWEAIARTAGIERQ
jgi:tripartite-type tricarboxylate transporter receptor subunit TctC